MKLLLENWREYLDEEQEPEQGCYEVDAIDKNEEYCPVCTDTMDEAKKKKACKPSKGKRFAKRVDGKCRSFGQAGQAKSGGDRIRPGTKKGDAYCARSAGIKKCKNPPCANTLSRKKWKCRGKKSMKEGDVIDFSAYKDKKAPKSWKPDEMLLIIKIENVVNDTLEEIFGLDVPEEVLENLESFLQSMEYNLE